MRLGEFLFRFRSFIPIPYIILLLIISNPSVHSIFSGVIFVFMGEFLRIYTQRFTGDWARGSRVGGDRVVREGPFSIVRHPLYTGNFLIGAGYTLLSGNRLALLIPLYILLFGIYYSLIIQAEEDYLTERFPDVYQEYKKSVAAFIPLSFNWIGGKPSSWKEGLKREKSTIITLLMIIIIFTWRFLWRH